MLFLLCLLVVQPVASWQRHISFGRKCVTGAIIGATLLASPVPSLADDVTGEVAAAPRPLRVITTTSGEISSDLNARSAGKVAVGSGGGDQLMDGKYNASLDKEKQKQDVEKKRTKEERRRELCETLGRGC